MALGPGVRYLSDVILDERKALDDMLWDAITPEEFIAACRQETLLIYLEELVEDGEEYWTEF